VILRQKIQDICEYLNYFPVIGVVGPRQVGKTTLVRNALLSVIQKDVEYLDLENPQDEAKLTDPVLFFTAREDKCIVLDEIQRRPDLFPILRSMIDANRVPARFIILGSASPELIRDSSESLAGRIVYEELHPFHLLEVENTYDYTYHWFAGGFPEAMRIRSPKIRQVWFSNFVRTYVERDLPLLGLNVDHLVIRKVWTMCAHMSGSLLNYSNIAKSLGVTSPTVKRYLSFLEQAYLIRLLQPYHVNIKKRLVKSPKIYIRDTGMLHHLLGVKTFTQLQGHPQLGNSWESYVVEQIIQLGGTDLEFFFYRTQVGAECDLVIVSGGLPIATVEVKYTSSPKVSKGYLQCIEDLNTLQNFIVTPETDMYPLPNNVTVCSIRSFVYEILPKLRNDV
jgi:uncharacterized protein